MAIKGISLGFKDLCLCSSSPVFSLFIPSISVIDVCTRASLVVIIIKWAARKSMLAVLNASVFSFVGVSSHATVTSRSTQYRGPRTQKRVRDSMNGLPADIFFI